jgi:hypothetical protein
MADTPFATATDVAARWRTLTSDEVSIANTLAIDASDMIRSRWPDVDSRIASGDLTAASLTRVAASMVKRAMIVGNNEGLESRSETAGPFAHSDKFTNPNANLYFTAEDIRLLDGRAARRAFAVDLSSNVAPCGYDRGYC